MPKDGHLGFYKHGNLPHFDAHGTVQFVTFVLADAAPRQRRPRLLEGRRPSGDSFFLQMDSQLDRGGGSCILRIPRLAAIVARQIRECPMLQGQRPAWVVMPNHVHLLFRQDEACRLGDVVMQIKTASSREINQLLGRSGKLWQKGYFDRAMRCAQHVQATVDYIHNNPLAAGLVGNSLDWAMSSVHAFDEPALHELCRIKATAG